MMLAQTQHIPQLRELWKKCFPDADEGYLDFYFSKGFPHFDTFFLEQLPGQVASMLTVIPAQLTGYCGSFAYIYAVGTDPACQGRGFASELMQQVEQYLKQQGCQAAMLFPAEEKLYSFYERLGYKADFFVSEMTGCDQDSSTYTITTCKKEDFIRIRRTWLDQRENAMNYPDHVLGYVYDEAVFTGGIPVLLSKNSRQDYALCYKIKQSLWIKETTGEVDCLAELCRYFHAEKYRALLVPEKKESSCNSHGMIKWFVQPKLLTAKIPYMNLVLD